MWYADETSFQQNPNSMYAWQAKGNTLDLPAKRGNLITVLGFITKDLQKAFYEFEGSINEDLFISIIEDFIVNHLTKKTILILDKCSAHTSIKVISKIKQWKEKNLFIQFLPTASSELNCIEILWKFIKHQWIAVNDWISAEKLIDSLKNILDKFGNEYKIHFKT